MFSVHSITERNVQVQLVLVLPVSFNNNEIKQFVTQNHCIYYSYYYYQCTDLSDTVTRTMQTTDSIYSNFSPFTTKRK